VAKVAGKKRKNGSSRQKESRKRRKGEDSEDDNDDDESTAESSASDSDVDCVSDSDAEDASQGESHQESSDSDSDEDDETDTQSDSGSEAQDEGDEEISVDSLKAKISELQEATKVLRDQLSSANATEREATDALATLKQLQVDAQREKNGFCSLKRSEVRTISLIVSQLKTHVHPVLARNFEARLQDRIERP
jgi:hypothetical protein